jgi:hypothetical protein
MRATKTRFPSATVHAATGSHTCIAATLALTTIGKMASSIRSGEPTNGSARPTSR